MKKTLLMVVMFVMFLTISQPVLVQSASQNAITLDEFVNGLVYNKQSRNFDYDSEKKITFLSYYLRNAQLTWYSNDTVGVWAMLQSQFDAVNKTFPTTDGKTVTMEKFRVVLQFSPKPVSRDKAFALIKKYEIFFKFGSPTFEITAKPNGMSWGRNGKYLPDTYGHFYVYLLIQSPTEQELEQLVKDVYFITTRDELNIALQQKSALRGIAISSSFYGGLTAAKKEKIKELVQYVKDARYRPIFIYGQPLDELVAKELLGKDTSGCKPPFFGGILPTKRADNSEAVINMCGGDNKQRSEEWLRNYINNYWKETKDFIKSHGTAVLN